MTNSSGAFRTPQEQFWAGAFGDEYRTRNTEDLYLPSNLALFARVLSRTGRLGSVIEFGANIGLNLSAIQALSPSTQLHAVEINAGACDHLSSRLPAVNTINQSLLDFIVDSQSDLVLIKGVLIHVNPDDLPGVYDKIANASAKYVLIVEYYNPTPVSIPYRGHQDRLFKRDFAGEFLDRHADFKVVDYGFSWHRDPVFPQDDLSWFLLERLK